MGPTRPETRRADPIASRHSAEASRNEPCTESDNRKPGFRDEAAPGDRGADPVRAAGGRQNDGEPSRAWGRVEWKPTAVKRAQECFGHEAPQRRGRVAAGISLDVSLSWQVERHVQLAHQLERFATADVAAADEALKETAESPEL